MPLKRKALLAQLDQTAAQRLPTLDLSNNKLDELIERVCQMDWLVELNLKHCHLGALPEAIGNLANLTRLSLDENHLAMLPDTIGNLARLESLSLALIYPLATLPESITRLTALRHLNLNHAGGSGEFHVSEAVKQWVRTVPEVIWTNGQPPNFEPPRPFVPGHPNMWLHRLRTALKLYSDALAMEDRSFNGEGKRAEGDALIRDTFEQVPELVDLLPSFHADFLAGRFHSTSQHSEKALDANPLRLPTKADEDWLAFNQPTTPLRLGDEIIAGNRRAISVHLPDGQRRKVASRDHGKALVSNMPYAPDEAYEADSAAWLYQAGERRFYLRVEARGLGGTTSVDWLGSRDGGRSWQEQPRLTQEWMDKFRVHWRELDRLPFAQQDVALGAHGVA